jgi:hypothetical protein
MDPNAEYVFIDLDIDDGIEPVAPGQTELLPWETTGPIDDNPFVDENATWEDWMPGEPIPASPEFDIDPVVIAPPVDGSGDDVAAMTLPELEPGVVGDPIADMEHWHQQATDFTCAVVSQEFILDAVTGQDFTEEQLMHEAAANGWLSPDGTAPADVGKLLELHGIPVERQYDATVDDLLHKLQEGEKVIVAVDAYEIWNPTNQWDLNDTLEDFTGIPGQDADHAVQVTGIDNTDPANPMVVLNDPGSPSGQGTLVPLDQFVGAWEDGGCYMVSTDLHAGVLGGFYNADGTYHWNSYHVDTDETGKVVNAW